tara:strand:+ start:73 stop:198 length:126 start_codon:yes stop_codon:yes gene_type:complete
MYLQVVVKELVVQEMQLPELVVRVVEQVIVHKVEQQVTHLQ